jgi:hypothetical protein
LLIGVIFLGAKIYSKSTELKSDLIQKKTHVEEKIVELKKEAEKKRLAAKKFYHEVKDALDKSGNQKKQPKKNGKKEACPLPKKTGIPKTSVTLNPLDEEDRKLTAEVLNKVTGDKKTLKEPEQTIEKKSEVSILEKAVAESEPEEPLDFNRITEIRVFYLKAIEILDGN